MKKSAKGILIISIVAVLMFLVAIATSYAATAPKINKKDTNSIIIESKAKTVTYKVTFNANGGKIGTKKTKITNVKKGKLIGKLPTTPTRTGYTFQGWYTKKTGGTKISKNTIVNKKVSYYAHWNKKVSSRALNTEEKKLVGTWVSEFDGSMVFVFSNDGSFISVTKLSDHDFGRKGNYSIKNGELTMGYYYSNTYVTGRNVWEPWRWETVTKSVEFGTRNGKEAFTYGLYKSNGFWFIKDNKYVTSTLL